MDFYFTSLLTTLKHFILVLCSSLLFQEQCMVNGPLIKSTKSIDKTIHVELSIFVCMLWDLKWF